MIKSFLWGLNYEVCLLYLDYMITIIWTSQVAAWWPMEGVLKVPRGTSHTEHLEVSTVPEEGAVPGTYCVTGRSAYRPEEAEGCTEWPLPLNKQIEGLPWSVCLLPETHSWIHGHHQATNPAHARKEDSPVISRSRSCFLVPKEVIVYGTTHPRLGEKFIVDTDTSSVGIEGMLSQVQKD
jgi:hypothetical protein